MATRTIANGGGNFSAAGTWVEGVAPVLGDACVATASSGQLTIDVASACTSIDFTNYVNTLTWNADLTTAGATKFVAGMTFAGTVGTLILNANLTLTSAGKSLPNLKVTGARTITFADAARVSGTTTMGATANTAIVLTSQTLRCDGDFTEAHGTSTLTGTCVITLGGTGTWSNNSTGTMANSLTINTAGTVTISGSVRQAGGTITYTAGTVVTTGSTLVVSAASTLNTSGMTWTDVNYNAAGGLTYTLSSNLNASGITTVNAATYSGAGEIVGADVRFASATPFTLNNGSAGSINTTGSVTLPNNSCTIGGSKGFVAGTLTTASISGNRVYTLTFGNTYTVNTAFKNVGTTAANRQAIISSSAGNKVVLTVNCTADLQYCDPTDVDSSAGTQVFSSRGTITTSSNWTSTVATVSQGSMKFAGDGGGCVG